MVMRSVQLDHLTKTLFALTPGAVFVPLATNTPKPLLDQPAPQGFMIHFPALSQHLLGGQGRPKVRISLLIASQHSATQTGAFTTATWLAATAVHQTRIAGSLKAQPDPFCLPIAYLHQPPSLSYAHLSLFDRL